MRENAISDILSQQLNEGKISEAKEGSIGGVFRGKKFLAKAGSLSLDQ